MEEERRTETQISIVRPTPDEWQVLRDLKLRSLDVEPIAFADPEPERQKYLTRTEAQWRAVLAGQRSDGGSRRNTHFLCSR